ncbi:MAG: holliday junction helicase RuvB [Actinomycetota bacterium]|nr:holliday junction helicase RuvB [Actinomycetota bacterium]
MTPPTDRPPPGPSVRPDDRAPDRSVVEAEQAGEDRLVETALRPQNLAEFVGQKVVREQLSLVLDAALRRGHPPDHILMSGPPGLGKTTLAMIVAQELGVPLRVTSGPAIQHAGDLAAVLSSLEPGEVLFLDEIHRMARPAEEMLYVAMEDFRVDIVVGKGAGATAIPLELPRFTIVGATTRAGMLPGPLRDRFGFTGHLDFYEPEELEQVLTRSAALLGVELTAEGSREIARRSRGTPRIANRLLRRVRDWAQVRGDGILDVRAADAALRVYAVDELGLDRLDRSVLESLCTRFGGGPVGLSTLAVTVGEEAETVETVAEPFLVREGLISRTPRGRIATAATWRHLGLRPPRDAAFHQTDLLGEDPARAGSAAPGPITDLDAAAAGPRGEEGLDVRGAESDNPRDAPAL